ncbi:class I SAM-dependent methyltransferase [Micromonospora sp. NPDC005173]|uniref:class I SAM-dependent methyltransferase n=1 Tax=Micromonospora sp. NPDC005173 TaxID=3157165 RepID=UPI0033AACBDD
MSRLMALVRAVNEKRVNFSQGISRTRRRDGSAAALRLALLWVIEGTLRPAKNIRQRRFDRSLCIVTTGRIAVTDAMRSAATHPDSTRYESMSPQQIKTLLRRLPIDSPAHFTFLDLGSGKGLPLVLAASYGFPRVLGVELDGGLVEMSRANVRSFETRSPTHAGVIGVTQGDAANVVLPPGPTVLFLFNPFGEATLRIVVDNIERSLKVSPRPFFVAYYNPVHREVLDERPSLRRVLSTTRLAMYEAHG